MERIAPLRNRFRGAQLLKKGWFGGASPPRSARAIPLAHKRVTPRDWLDQAESAEGEGSGERGCCSRFIPLSAPIRNRRGVGVRWNLAFSTSIYLLCKASQLAANDLAKCLMIGHFCSIA